MNKAILLLCSPEECKKILNGDLSILVRKLKPKCDLPINVYIYCAKNGEYLTKGNKGNVYPSCCISNGIREWHLNGKVVAKFWCDKVENIYVRKHSYCCEEFYYCTNTLEEDEICKKSRLDNQQLQEYLGDNLGYAIHITKLETFEKPKELSEFRKVGFFDKRAKNRDLLPVWADNYKLTKAPTRWCYVEV
jgi:predicted transcriptional regulator